MKKLTLIFALILTNIVSANVILPKIFSDNMVLQRNSEITIWGWATPYEEIIVKPSWSNEEVKVKASNHAIWEVKIKTTKEGGPYTIFIKGYNEITLKNILLGEVWLCSGQSNMEMTAGWGITNGDEEVKNANFSNIRFFTVPKLTSKTPQDDLRGNWEVCSSETMKNFSAVAYFFARRLQEDLKNVPIGLISSNWGGSPAEIWIPQDAVENNPVVLQAAQRLKEEQWAPSQPGRAYNAMIYPIINFKIAGAIWYQGESNVGSDTYTDTFSALIQSWRKLWNDDFPFYFVQIAPYKYGEDHFGGVVIRDAQRKTLQKVPNTGMVVTSDIGDIEDIHPKDKRSVGFRLANLALANTYKTNSALVNGPLFKNIKTEKNKTTVYFDYAEGLHFKGKNADLFEVAGSDGIFYTAKAEIKNNTVQLISDKVKNPVKVRYAWKNIGTSDLFNKANLPASSFISE